MRILLFLLTNMAVGLVVMVVWQLLGFGGFLEANGVDLNLESTLVFCLLYGMGCPSSHSSFRNGRQNGHGYACH